jgi:putative nucleotidyltransferase with HDIG domain
VIDLDQMARAASQLEPLPTSSTRLAALVCAGTPELGQVVEIVQFDEALTASLLRSANSSWSSSRSEIKTVRDAVIRLGASPVLALTLGMNVRRHLGDALPQYGMSEGELWRHSVAASLAAELMAPRAAHRPPPETATAALLHDVGKLVMARFLEPSLLEELHACQEGGATRVEAEFEVLGIDHAELGGLIARSWALPETLVRGIREHGRPGVDGDVLVHAVYLSDVLAKAVGAGLDDNVDPDARTRALGELGFTETDFDELKVLVGERLAEVEQRFD